MLKTLINKLPNFKNYFSLLLNPVILNLSKVQQYQPLLLNHQFTSVYSTIRFNFYDVQTISKH